MCGTHSDLLGYTNEAIEEFWSMGDWVGKNQRYKIRVTMDCHNRRCITWPRQIETIEMVSVCNNPIGVRTQYFEFIENGPSQLGAGCGYPLVGDRSEVVLNHDLSGDPKRVKVYTERIETAGQILLLGVDENGNWVRTQDGDGAWVDGEYLDLTATPATSTKYFAPPGPTGIQFTSTPRNGNVYLYSLDDAAEEIQLATYDYAVETPVMRRSIFTGFGNGRVNADEEARCHCVTVLAKTRFMPVRFDTDYPQISNVAALKSMLQYIYKRDNGKPQEAEYYKQEAINILNNELKQYNGYGAKKVLPFLPRQLVGASRNLM